MAMASKSLQICAAAFLCLVIFSLCGLAQPRADSKPPNLFLPALQDHRLKSRLMGREMPYRVLVPRRERGQPERFPVVFLLHGLTGHYNNWSELTKLAESVFAKRLIVVMPEGGNGWYTDSFSVQTEKWESYIVQELIPDVEKKFGAWSHRNMRAIAGLSMGGYGSIKFGLKYPEKFVIVGSFSGALGAASFTEKVIPGAIGRSIDGIFGPVGSDARKSNDIFEIVRSLTPEKTKVLPFIYLDCGTEDFLFQNNRDFVNILVEKRVPHEYRQLPGSHDWKYWDQQVQEFLGLADRMFAGK